MQAHEHEGGIRTLSTRWDGLENGKWAYSKPKEMMGDRFDRAEGTCTYIFGASRAWTAKRAQSWEGCSGMAACTARWTWDGPWAMGVDRREWPVSRRNEYNIPCASDFP